MNNSKVVWLEGMPLCAQHFQQHDRFIENMVNGRSMGLKPFNWGFHTLTINTDLLKIGQFAIKSCSGVFQDGTPFEMPGGEDPPLPLQVPEDMGNELMYLALPVRRPEAVETDSADYPESLARYRMTEGEVKNNMTLGEGQVPLYIGRLKTRFLSEREERSGYTCLGVARVVEVRADKNVIIDDKYIPPNINCIAITNLNGFMRELVGLLNTRGEAIAARMGAEGHGGVAEISDFMLLQVVNRYQVLFKHLSSIPDFHPEEFYQLIIQLAGELATFFSKQKRPGDYPPYRHEDLLGTFLPVMEDLRKHLAKVYEQRAVPIELSDPKFNTYAARRPDISLLQNAVFVLAVKAEVDNKTLQTDLPNQTVIAPVETVNKYIQALIPGISIHLLPAVPRQLPYHPGFVYFELNTKSDLWKEMMTSAGIAIHISGNLPGLQLEFWAIKQG